MTLGQAQAAAATFRECLLDNGVRKVSIELQPGVAGSGWFVGTFKRGMGHHIASRPSQGLTPGLATVKNGRGGENPLTGPLANCYGGWDYVARIITLGWANHPGAGGPWSVPGWGTVPEDNGRPYSVGWEFEGGYEPYTDEMHHFMACCGAGTLDFLGTLPGNPGPAPLECWGEHKDPWAPGRKIDRLGYTAASGRARIADVRGSSSSLLSEGLADMQLVKTPDGKVYKLTDFDVSHEGNPYRLNALAKARKLTEADIVAISYDELRDNQGDVQERRARVFGGGVDVDEAAIVAGLLPKLTEALVTRTGITREDIEQVVRGVFGDAAVGAGS